MSIPTFMLWMLIGLATGLFIGLIIAGKAHREYIEEMIGFDKMLAEKRRRVDAYKEKRQRE